MNYLLKSKPKSNLRPRLLAAVSVYIVLSLFIFLFSGVFRKALWTVARPVWTTSSFISRPFASIKNYFSFKNTLISQNLALQDENTALKVKEIDYDNLVAENQNLKTELGRKTDANKILAAILSKPPRSAYDTVVIDLGSSDGAAVGDKVYVGDNVIVGVITQTTTSTSLVNLFSTGGEKQEATLARTGASFTLTGNGGQNFTVEVPKDTDVLWGDTFIYPGVDQSEIGVVYYIDSDSQSSFKTLYLRTPVDVFASQYLMVEK